MTRIRTEEYKAKDRVASKRSYYKRTGVGKLATDDEVLFYGYKEPLRKFEGGFGYKGVLSYSKDRDKVQCHICGCLFQSLGKHLQKTHGLDATSYKDKVGLSHNTALIGEGLREKLMNRERPNELSNKKGIKKSLATRRRLYKEAQSDPKLKARLWPKRTLEYKNKRGLCPDQLLDMIRKTKESFGHVPTMEEFKDFHHGKFVTSIRLTFGNYGNALAKLGLESNWKKHDRKSLIESLKTFYEVHKRCPRWSDQERGLLPNRNSFRRHFMKMSDAFLLAGIPLRIRVGNHYEDWKPTKEERAKMLAKIA